MKKSISFCLAAAFLITASSVYAVEFNNYAYNCAQNKTVFVSGYQRFARLKNSDGWGTAKYNPTAGAVGYIYSQGAWHAGAAFSYEYGNRKYNIPGDTHFEVRSSTPGISLFGGIKTQAGYYVDASAFLGYATYKGRKYSIPGVDSFDGNRVHKTVFATGLEAGKIFDMGDSFLLTPHIGIDYAHTPSERYVFGSDVYTNKSQDYLEIPLGVSLSKTFNCGSWLITPKVDLTMVNSIGGIDTTNTQPGFSYRTADSWKVAGIGGDHIGGRITAGVNAQVNDRTTLGLDYTYEGRKSYNDHRISAMFGWAF